jgi:hypothetical protein
MDIESVTVNLDRPEDLLAYLPYRFGYVPTESLAMVTVLEASNGVELGLAARLDLADLAIPGVLAAAAGGIRAQMLRDPTVSAFTVVYTESPFEEVRAARSAAGRALAEWLEEVPLTSRREAFVVSSTSFRCVECRSSPCCPPEGHPLVKLTGTAIAAGMVMAGETLAPNREALGCPRLVDAERLATATRAADTERQEMRRRAAGARARWRRRMLDLFGVALVEAAAQRGPWLPDPAVLGRLGAALAEPALRDAIVAWTVSGERSTPGSEEVLAGFTGMVTGGLELPDRTHRQAVRAVLTEIIRHSPPGRAGYALAMLGWLAWWCGEGARADVLMRQCLDDQPGCTLGQLLSDVLDAGVRPGWARSEPWVSPVGR